MTEQLNDAESRLNSQAMMIELHINEARSDPLTTLANRRAFDDEMRNQIQQFEQHATPASVLLLDIDHFKMLNDAHGHIVGDDVLIAVSQAIKQHIRTEDFAARYGGEEFAIIFPRTRVEQAISIAERVRASVSRAVCQITDQPIRITASGGLSLLMPMDTQKSWLDRADKALYYSKDSGRDCGHFSDGEAFKPFVERARPLPSASKSTNIKSSDVLQDSPLEADDAQELLDPVTQLLSAETFKKYFARTLAERRRTGTALSLIMIRIDRFQDYPQRYGITTDSLILRIIGRLLHSSVRSSDHVARYANDSLIILLPKANLINAVRVAKRLGAAIEKLNLRLADQRIDLTVSMGVGEERGSDGSALLIDRVTRAVAIASRSGGNQLVVSDGEMFDRETFATHCEKSAPADSPLSTATPRIPPISPIFPNPGFDPAVPSHWSSS
jgi:diguanylate cyclase